MGTIDEVHEIELASLIGPLNGGKIRISVWVLFCGKKRDGRKKVPPSIQLSLLALPI